MTRGLKHIVFGHPTKFKIRDSIANSVKKKWTLLDFYGDGGMYNYCKKRGINVFSIDNGHDFKNKVSLRKKLTRRNDMAYTSLSNLADRAERKFEVLWLDYCGPLGKHCWRDMIKLNRIMADKGYVYITYSWGHESGIFSKGIDRRILDSAYLAYTKEAFAQGGVEIVEQVMREHYLSVPKYKGRGNVGGTNMVTVGYKYKKICK